MARTKECVNRTELILDAAHELFGRYGFERTTIDDIARQAGIGKGSVYLEYKTKDEILMAVVGRFARRKHDLFQQHWDNASSPYLEALKQMLVESLLCSYDAVTSHYHTPETLIHTSRKVKAGFRDHFLFCQNMVAQFLLKAAENGEIEKPGDASRQAELIMLSCSGLVPPYVQYLAPSDDEIPPRASIEENARALLGILMDGLKTRNSQRS